MRNEFMRWDDDEMICGAITCGDELKRCIRCIGGSVVRWFGSVSVSSTAKCSAVQSRADVEEMKCGIFLAYD
jgi:hypothetical protein